MATSVSKVTGQWVSAACALVALAISLLAIYGANVGSGQSVRDSVGSQDGRLSKVESKEANDREELHQLELAMRGISTDFRWIKSALSRKGF